MPTGIEWTDETWNPVAGCTKVSPGCDHCYAETMTNRFKRHPFEEVQLHWDRLAAPLKWKTPKKIFVCSMGDLFHSEVPWEFIVQVFNIMAAWEWHTFQVLTKRPGRMAYFAEHVWPTQGGRWEPIRSVYACQCGWSGNESPYRPPGSMPTFELDRAQHSCPKCGRAVRGSWPGTKWPDNVWAGTSVENQKYAPRLDVLARVPAKVRFVSYEPALGPVDFGPYLWPASFGCPPCIDYEEGTTSWPCGEHDDSYSDRPLIHWVIAGGESGAGARPAHPDWFRSVRDQCAAAGVPFFFKQWGLNLPHGQRGMDGAMYLDSGFKPNLRLGKKYSGDLLDGVQHHEFPVVPALVTA